MKLSIIVPVYNVECYVRKCVLSIINQEDDMFKEIELIIVNDGTKDKSIEQIQDLINGYDNIYLINQENSGLSVARNNGMKNSSGDYVWFIDSDDWITSDAVKVLMPYFDGMNDIVSFGYTKVTEDEESLCAIYYNESKTFSGKETFRRKCEFATMAQRAVYRKKFLDTNNLYFMPGILNEDDELCLRASYLAENVTLIPQSIYYFLRTSGDKHKSIMNTVKPKLGYDFLIVSKSLSNFANEYVKEKDLYKSFQQHISVLLNSGLSVISKCQKTDQLKFLEMYSNLGGFNKCYFKGGGKYLLEGILFSLFPNEKIKIFKMLQSAKN